MIASLPTFSVSFVGPLVGDRRVGAPLRVVDVAVQHDHADGLHAGLQLERLGLRLAGRQHEFLRAGIVLTQRLLLVLGQREHVAALELRGLRQLVDAHRDRRGLARRQSGF